MKLGIISDTHGNTDYVKRAVDKFEENNVDLIVHCGDVTRPQHLDSLFSLTDNPLQLVLGNCDRQVNAFRQASNKNKINLHGEGVIMQRASTEIAVTHGNSNHIIQRLLDEEPDYLFRGHSHEKTDRSISGTRLINPGSAGRASHSVALLETAEDKLQFIDLDNR